MKISIAAQQAYTLIETLITLSIITILASLTLPQLKYFTERSSDNLQLQQLTHIIQLAQQESSSLHSPVIICKSKDGATCSGTWSQGQLIFIDSYQDGKIHDKQQLVLANQTPSLHGMLNWRAFPFYNEDIRFQATTLIQHTNGTFWYCHSSERKPVWALTLSKSGRVHAEYPNKDGEIVDGLGKPLNCDTVIPVKAGIYLWPTRETTGLPTITNFP